MNRTAKEQRREVSFLLALSMLQFSWSRVISSVCELEAYGHSDHPLCRRYRDFVSVWPSAETELMRVLERPTVLNELTALWHEAVPAVYPEGHVFHDHCLDVERALEREAMVARRVYGGPTEEATSQAGISKSAVLASAAHA